MRSFGFLVTFGVCLLVAAGAEAAAKPDDTVTAATFEAYCKQARATSDLAKLKAISDSLNENLTRIEEQLEQAEAEAKEAGSALEGVAFQYQATLDQAITDLDKKISAARTERERLSAVMIKERNGPIFDQAFRARNAKFEEIKALGNERGGKAATRAKLADAMAEFALTDDKAKKAAAIRAIIPELGAGGMAVFALPSARSTSADLVVEGLNETWNAAKVAGDCVEQKLVTLEDATSAEAKFLRDEAVRLGKEMQAKGKAIGVAEQAAKKLWASVNSLEDILDSPEMEQANSAYLRAMDEYLAVGTEFRAAVERYTRKGGKLEPWMTELDARYEKVKADSNALKAQLDG